MAAAKKKASSVTQLYFTDTFLIAFEVCFNLRPYQDLDFATASLFWVETQHETETDNTTQMKSLTAHGLFCLLDLVIRDQVTRQNAEKFYDLTMCSNSGRYTFLVSC